MSSNPASATLLQEARTEFEKLVALITSPEASTATLDRMERSLFRRLLRLGLQLLQLFIATRVEAEAHGVHSGADGRVLPYHSQQPASYFSVFGKVTFRRAYFYRGGQSCCPLDAALSLPARCYSDFLMELAGELAVDGVFEKALEMLGKFLSLALPKLALETWVHEESALVTAFYDQKAAFPANSEGQILVAQADGKGVPMVRSATATARVRRGKGNPKTRKKEAIATALYTIAPYPRTPPSIVEALFPPEAKAARTSPERPSPCHKQVFATMNGKAWALERLQARVHQRDSRRIRARVALTDGALALQQRIQEKLPAFTLVLDTLAPRWRAAQVPVSFTSLSICGKRVMPCMAKLIRNAPCGSRPRCWISCRATPTKSSSAWKTRPAPCARPVRPARYCSKSPTTSGATKRTWTMPPICAEAGPLAPA